MADVLASKLAFECDQPQPAKRPRRGARETMSRSTALPAITTFLALKEPGKVPMATRRLQGKQLLS